MRDEDKLIFLFSRINLDESKLIQIEMLLNNHLDWDYILEESQKEGVSCLIYRHLYNLKTEDRVWQYLDQLKIEYHRNSIRNTIILEEAKKILNAFNEKKIKTIVLKGIFLGENIYKNIAFRPIGDIDILIKKEDLSKVNEILNSLGYSAPAHYKDFLKIPSLSSVNTLMYNPQQPIHSCVHLHWHLINSSWPLDFLVRKIDMERIWSQAEPVKIDGIDALTLSPHHLLLYLGQHSFNHAFDRLILVSDILEVLRHYNDRLNWQLLIDEAERFNLSSVLYYSLRLSCRLLDFKIPQLERFKRPKAGFSDRFFSFLIYKGVRTSAFSYFMYLSMQRGVLDKLRFMARTIFPSRYVLAHNFMLKSSQIRPYHYYQRIMNKAFKFLR